MKKTSQSIIGGVETSLAVGAQVRKANRKLDEAQNRFADIKADSNRSPVAKADFLTKWRHELAGSLKTELKIIRGEIAADQKDFEKASPEKPQLTTHGALLLAEAIKNAAPGKRLGLVTSDPRYAALLRELPASYFGMTEERHKTLLHHATNFGLSPEQRDISETKSANEQALLELKSRRDELIRGVDGYLETLGPEQEAAEKTAHLYELENDKQPVA